MDPVAEAEAGAEDATAVAFAVEGVVAELKALRPTLVAAEARADAAEARAGAATARAEASAADLEGVQRVVHEVLRAAGAGGAGGTRRNPPVDDDDEDDDNESYYVDDGEMSSRLAEGLSAAEAVRLALEVAANEVGRCER